MKNIYIKIYVFFALINIILNFVFGLFEYVYGNYITLFFLCLIGLFDLLIFPTSIILIIYIIIKRINKIYLNFPFLFFLIYIFIFFWMFEKITLSIAGYIY